MVRKGAGYRGGGGSRRGGRPSKVEGEFWVRKAIITCSAFVSKFVYGVCAWYKAGERVVYLQKVLAALLEGGLA
jgi:hypothetical protein